MKAQKTFLVLIFFHLLILLSATAQKLPNLQQTGILTPKNLRVDGKAIELNNRFQAYNKSLGAYYTITNDDVNLYIVIQATDDDIIKKMVLGGVTFSIASKKASITYPVYDRVEPMFLSLSKKPLAGKDSKVFQNETRLFAESLNKQLNSPGKSIKIGGIRSIQDSLLSVYNEQSIKAAGAFDDQLRFTYELLVPLKYLTPTATHIEKLDYRIRLNGGDSNGNKLLFIRPDYVLVIAKNEERFGTGSKANSLTVTVPTDLQGEYILAK